MTLSQFNCPHCHSPFQADTSLPSLQVACPHCRQPVALLSEPPLAVPPVIEPPLADSTITEPPTSGPRNYSPADLLPPGTGVSPEEVMPARAEEHEAVPHDRRSRHLAAEERASRKFVKNLIVWVCCAIVLVSILAFFLMQGGS
ncbi:MAG: hypothetical protein O3C40_05660 [Planctomycetota bacterium]|nr:hypothetical protein [Planctomycetota bacterium]